MGEIDGEVLAVIVEWLFDLLALCGSREIRSFGADFCAVLVGKPVTNHPRDKYVC
jgi:hypothetical protein